MTVLLAACVTQQKTQPIVTPEPTPAQNDTMVQPTVDVVPEKTDTTVVPTKKATTATATTSYTATEVATHSSASSCWLILDAKVYDVTKFIPSHPGGNDILKGCGKDATKMFSKHPESAKAMKEQFYIGDLKA